MGVRTDKRKRALRIIQLMIRLELRYGTEAVEHITRGPLWPALWNSWRVAQV